MRGAAIGSAHSRLRLPGQQRLALSRYWHDCHAAYFTSAPGWRRVSHQFELVSGAVQVSKAQAACSPKSAETLNSRTGVQVGVIALRLRVIPVALASPFRDSTLLCSGARDGS